MSLILAIEPDRRQGAHLTALARGPLNVELVIGDTTERAFEALGPRVPDLVLTSLLLSPKDESSLAERLRELDAAGAHVQTLVIPVLGSPDGGKKRSSGGIFGRLRRSAAPGKSNDGCDPTVFGTQIAEYLERAVAERAALAAAQADLEAAWSEEPPPLARAVDAEMAVESAVETITPAQATDDPEALFGEFAAIPIGGTRAVRSPAETPTPPAPEPDPVRHGSAHDEDWEEIALDVSHADPRNELVAEAVDLDAFVQELHSVETSHEAEPAIPVVDLEPADDAGQYNNDETVFAIVEAPASALDLSDELEQAGSQPVEAAATWPPLDEPTPSVFVQPPSVPGGLELDEFAAALGQAATSSTMPEWPEATAEADAPVEPPASAGTGWQDLLSAIRRDISSIKTEKPEDYAPPVAARPEIDLSKEPLVFPARPARPAVIASVIAEAMTPRRERPRISPEDLPPLPTEIAHSVEESLQASLAAPLAFTPEPLTEVAPQPEVSQLQAEIEMELARAIDVSAAEAVRAIEAPSGPQVSAPSTSDAEIEALFAQVEAAAQAHAEPPPEPVAPVFTDEATQAVVADEGVSATAPAEVPEPTAVTIAEPAAEAARPPRRDHERREPRAPRSKKGRRQRHAKTQIDSPVVRPRVPDWGFIDPHVGFAALAARLNEAAGQNGRAASPSW